MNLRKGQTIKIHHEVGVEVGVVRGWTHSARYGDTTLVDIAWTDGTISSVSIDWIVA
jgi:hypothetical protein